MTLPLTLPRQVTNRRLPLNRGGLRAWLDEVPVANAPEAARCLIQQLSAMNRSRLGAGTRIAFAEMIREKAETILPALESNLALATLPLSGTRRTAAGVADELLAELAYAYKAVLVALYERLLPVSRRAFHLSLLQATRSLARRLAVGYRVYAPAPATVWQELHLLYRLASKRDCAEAAVPGHGSSLSSVYRQALLLAFAQPYKLMQGDVDRILGYVAAFVDHSKLTLGPAAADSPGTFLIDPGRDVPGTAVAKAGPAGSASDCPVLNCQPLVEVLLDQIERLDAGAAPRELGLPAGADAPAFQHLMQRLARHWGNVATRQFGRLRTHARVEILIGLRPIWNYLINADARATANSPSNMWMVTNESPGGFAVMHISGKCAPIRVGEVIAVRTPETCHICFVRWVLSDSPEHLELGLQQFASGATPVALGNERNASVEPALLLPEIPALRQPAAILARYGQVDAAHPFVLDGGNSRVRVRATRLHDQTTSVQMFHFRAAGAAAV